MLKISDMTGVAVFFASGKQGRGLDIRRGAAGKAAAQAAGKATAQAADKATAQAAGKRLGKVHLAVFAPGGTRVVGFLVKRPDVAGMVRRADAFVALDSLAPCDGGLRITRDDGVDDAARARLGIDGAAWDACVIWGGMDAVTEGGRSLGFVDDASFDAKTGAVSSFFIGDGNVATRLVGTLEVPAGMLRGYREGRMVVASDAAKGELTGGLAARAGAAAGRAQLEGSKAASKAGAAAAKAADRGSRALGRQLGKTRGMFGAFLDEYKKASK